MLLNFAVYFGINFLKAKMIWIKIVHPQFIKKYQKLIIDYLEN